MNLLFDLYNNCFILQDLWQCVVIVFDIYEYI